MTEWSNYIGLILPPVIDVVNTRIENAKLRFAAAMVICLLVAILTNFSKFRAGNVGEVLQDMAIAFAEAQVVYNLYWKGSTMRQKMVGY